MLMQLLKLVARMMGLQVFAPESRDEVLLIPNAVPQADPDPNAKPIRNKKTLSIKDDLLPQNEFSRGMGLLTSSPLAVVVHWVANPSASAKGIRDYFSTLNGRYASTHYVIGKRGEVIRMLPDEEEAYHVGAHKYMPGIVERFGYKPNRTTLGIECCHEDWAGRMTPETMQSLEILCADLLSMYGLSTEGLMLHRDFTGKQCHRWFVDNPNEWMMFKERVAMRMHG